VTGIVCLTAPLEQLSNRVRQQPGNVEIGQGLRPSQDIDVTGVTAFGQSLDGTLRVVSAAGKRNFPGQRQRAGSGPCNPSGRLRRQNACTNRPQFGAIRTEPGNPCLRRTAWWGWEDSNFQPNDYQSLALSSRHRWPAPAWHGRRSPHRLAGGMVPTAPDARPSCAIIACGAKTVICRGRSCPIFGACKPSGTTGITYCVVTSFSLIGDESAQATTTPRIIKTPATKIPAIRNAVGLIRNTNNTSTTARLLAMKKRAKNDVPLCENGIANKLTQQLQTLVL
jgi:hypothetical protein